MFKILNFRNVGLPKQESFYRPLECQHGCKLIKWRFDHPNSLFLFSENRKELKSWGGFISFCLQKRIEVLSRSKVVSTFVLTLT